VAKSNKGKNLGIAIVPEKTFWGNPSDQTQKTERAQGKGYVVNGKLHSDFGNQ